MHLGAKHIVCIFRLPGRNFVKYQHGIDDSKHGATRFILNAMRMKDILYRVIFITRYYSGQQIGPVRFEGYLKAARSVILHHPLIESKNITHVPWSEEYCSFVDKTMDMNRESTRGRHSNRGQSRDRGRSYEGRRPQTRGRGSRGRGARGGLYHVDNTEHLTDDE